MVQRRVAWAALAVVSFAAFGGCRGETTNEQHAAATGAVVTLNIVNSKHAGQLLRHVESTFRLPKAGVAAKKVANAAKNAAKTVPMLSASPITQFTLEGEIIRPVMPAPATKNAVAPTIGLPKTGDGSVSISVSGVGVDVKPRGFAATTVEWAEHLAVYADVEPGTHAYRRVDASGVEDFYEVATPADVVSFTYDLSLSGVAGLRLVGTSLELLDASGTPRLATSAPVVVDKDGARRVGRLAVSGCAYDTSPNGPWGRPVVAPGSTHCVLTASVDAKGLAFPVLVDPAWRPTFDTRQTHAYHQMLYIPAGVDAGKVLIVGGEGSAPVTTELFDPATNTWADAGSIPDAAGLGEGCNAAVLSDGTVILAGGFPAGTTSAAKATAVKRSATAATPRWSFAGSMTVTRAWFAMQTVTVAGKQQVLAAGGQPSYYVSSSALPRKTSELYDPTTDTWTATATSMNFGHTLAGSAVMAGGKVLVAGGYSTTDTAAAAADVFDPATGAWLSTTAVPVMNNNRGAPIVVGVGAGAVVFGGFDSSFDALSIDTAEYWDGTAFRNLTAKLSEPRAYGAGALLDDGRVLIAGGQTNVDDGFGGFTTAATNSADLFAPGSDPKTGTIVGTASMGAARRFHAMVNIPTKGALATGGDDGTAPIKTSEMFDTTLGRPCGSTACPSGTFCTEGVCCEKAACPEGQTCATPGHEGVCTKPLGATCSTNTECATGHCADGVCCNSACTSDCSTCNVPGKVGTCTLAPAGTDPKGRCFDPTYDDPGCGSSCDGAGSCYFYPPAGTPCAPGGGDATADTGLFCKAYACDGYGTCSTTTNDCGLTCTSSTTCDEATKTCSASASGIKAGFCVIDSTCLTYGDINPKNKCQMCDPPTSKTAWSVATSCKEGGVEDTGADVATDTAPKDTGVKDTAVADTSSADTAPADTGVPAEDSGAPDNSLPEQSACSCDVPGNDSGPSLGAVLGLALGALLVARRRRRS